MKYRDGLKDCEALRKQHLDRIHKSMFDQQQRWKETLISMLRERGLVFPATERLRAAIERDRIVPPEGIEDLIMGRKSVEDFPERKKP